MAKPEKKHDKTHAVRVSKAADTQSGDAKRKAASAPDRAARRNVHTVVPTGASGRGNPSVSKESKPKAATRPPVVERLPAPVVPLGQGQKGTKAAAVKVPVASPRPESLGMESTSPGVKSATKEPELTSPGVKSATKEPELAFPGVKSATKSAVNRDKGTSPRADQATSLPPTAGVTSAFAQRHVMWFHHPDNYHVMGVVWAEHENLHKARIDPAESTATQVVRVVKGYHVLHRAQSGGVDHTLAPPQDASHFSPIKAVTTLETFEEYLRDCLRKFGGPRDAWTLLGLEAPRVEAAPAPESAPAHDEMYERASRLLGTPEAELRAKYGHLNPGLQQMNLRNRLRAKGHNV